jgi:FtsH-binding integral membrane protein
MTYPPCVFALRPATVLGVLVVLIVLAFFGLGEVLATIASILFWLVVLGAIAMLVRSLVMRRGRARTQED